MRLEIPFASLLPDGGSVLIAGMGGGFDVFCGLPLFFELQSRGFEVHLASLSFAALKEYQDCEWLSPSLVKATPQVNELFGYHPERHLCQWFLDCLRTLQPIYCFDPCGAEPLLRDLRILSNLHGLDAIILVDGGVDSLTRGDEELCGTILEDYMSIAATNALDEVPARILTNIGMGVEGDVSHSLVFENIASLTKHGGFLGVSALQASSEPFQRYHDALEYVHSQPGQQPSVINASIVSSVLGEFGDHHRTGRTRGSELSITPLMSLYWFFTIESVATQNLFTQALMSSCSMGEVFAATYEEREKIELRPTVALRLT